MILLKQETVSGSGIIWAICKSALRSRQITTPAPHHSFFTCRMPFLPPNQQCQSTEGQKWYQGSTITGSRKFILNGGREMSGNWKTTKQVHKRKKTAVKSEVSIAVGESVVHKNRIPENSCRHFATIFENKHANGKATRINVIMLQLSNITSECSLLAHNTPSKKTHVTLCTS